MLFSPPRPRHAVPLRPRPTGLAVRVARTLLGSRSLASHALLSTAFLTALSLATPVGRTAGVETLPTPRCAETRAPTGLILLVCEPGFATPHDTVSIYLRSPSSDRTSDAIWVFEVAGGRPTLIIDFHPSQAGPVADLYDDRDGDGSVDFELVEGFPRVVESPYPTVSVTSRDGWWTQRGRTSFNLDIVVDGPVRASFTSSVVWPLSLLPTDGTVDFEIHVRDRDQDGDPEDDWRQDYPPLSEDPRVSGHNRTHIVSNPQGDEIPITGSLLWPYLGYTVGDFVKEYGVSRPPIAVDWKGAKIVQVGEFVASRGNPGNFFIYSHERVQPGQTTTTNFENPFAFYDLAQRNDGWPDMAIRVEATLPNDVPDMPDSEPVNIVRWSWDQQHAHQWDYALNLVGRQRVDQTIRFPEFSVLAVPPERLPDWLAEQTWQAATFVEVTKPYWTSEGVYEYSVAEDRNVLPFRYVTGLDRNPPTAVFDDIPEGFRGEYSFDLGGLARIYLSQIDGRPHLVNADGGVWNLRPGS